MEFDYSKLRGRIREVFGTQEDFVKAIGVNKGLRNNKLTNLQDNLQIKEESKSENNVRYIRIGRKDADRNHS